MKIGIVGLGYRLGYLSRIIKAVLPEARFVGYVDPSPVGHVIPNGVLGLDPDGRPRDLGPEMREPLDAGPSYATIAEMHKGSETSTCCWSVRPITCISPISARVSNSA